MKYWKTGRPEVIDEIFQKFLKVKRELTFWQQITEKDRYRFNGVITEIKDDKCLVKVDNHTEIDKDFLKKDSPLFSHAARENIIFKKERFLFNGIVLEFKKPHEIQISEKRTVERFYYKYQDHKSVTFANSPDLIGKSGSFYTAVMVDISIRGVGFVVDYDSQATIRKGSIIYLKNLTDQTLPEPFPAKVAYIEPYSTKSNEELYKVGILFEKDLDSISYRSITSIVEKKQQQVMGLRPDRYCGVSLEEQAIQLRKIAKENRQLALNIRESIDYLDTLRYLTTQMKKEFLLEVNLEVLATALRLSSKELIFELFSETTQTMQNEFLERLSKVKPASAISKAQDQIASFVKEKESVGEYILDPLAYITYV